MTNDNILCHVCVMEDKSLAMYCWFLTNLIWLKGCYI